MALRFDLRRACLSAACGFAAAGVTVAGVALAGDSYPMQIPTVQYSLRQPLGASDTQALTQALEGARMNDPGRIRSAMSAISDPLARKIALWALIETDPDGMSYAELDSAGRDLAGWPGAAKRIAATEKVIEGGGLSPRAVVAWFAGADPVTPEGAMALAAAYQATGQTPKAAEVIRRIWRAKPFDSQAQQQMMSRFSALLTPDDYAAREDMLLYGAQGDAARDLLPYLTADQRSLAEARLALREGSPDAESLVAALPPALQDAPGLKFEQALRFHREGEDSAALAALPSLTAPLPDEEAQTRSWRLRKALVVSALESGDSRAAYRAAADSGVASGEDGAEAEFYAGWLALSRLKDPKLADAHFARLQQIGGSPITMSRALYWRGRAAEAMGDAMDAQVFFANAAQYQTAFYGQLAAAKIGQGEIELGKDPVITADDRARFEAREPVRAARLMAEIGADDSFKSFVMGLADTASNPAEAAQLVDLARNNGDQALSMRVVRKVAQHGFVLPERGYPIHLSPSVGGAETAFVLGVTREESGFDPHVRSPAGALGMMQLMPGTAQILARKLGYSYDPDRLEDADFNMELGSAYLGELVDRFSGSYLMAAAAYNAGPGRPAEWTSFCGDPRASSTDPADYIECIPFSETRNYVMRVLEAMEVYRARLKGGAAKVSLAADLKRGGYGYGYTPGEAYRAGPSETTLSSSLSASGLNVDAR